jgi:WD40 repeat protein
MHVVPIGRQRVAGVLAILLAGVFFPVTPGQSETPKREPNGHAKSAKPKADAGRPGEPAGVALDFEPPARPLSGVNSPVLALAYAPDGRTLALGDADQTAQLRAEPGGEVQHTLKGHADAVTCLAFAPDGKTLATGSTDTVVKLWDVTAGAERRALAGHTSSVYAVAFSPDGKTLASAGYDKTIRLWE